MDLSLEPDFGKRGLFAVPAGHFFSHTMRSPPSSWESATVAAAWTLTRHAIGPTDCCHLVRGCVVPAQVCAIDILEVPPPIVDDSVLVLQPPKVLQVDQREQNPQMPWSSRDETATASVDPARQTPVARTSRQKRRAN